MGPYARVDYNLTLCRLQHMYHGQPYARVELNHVLESTLSPNQDKEFGLCSFYNETVRLKVLTQKLCT